MMLTDVERSGRCGRSPIGLVAGRPPIPAPTAVALDGRWLYYASDRGVHRRRLPARGSTAPPANDDLADALEIRGDLPAEVFGRIRYATREPGEPRSGRRGGTVWYAFTPAASGTVQLRLSYGKEYRVFAGTALGTLRPVVPPSIGTAECAIRLDVVRGRSYRISVSDAVPRDVRPPDLQPFTIRIVKEGSEPRCV